LDVIGTIDGVESVGEFNKKGVSDGLHFTTVVPLKQRPDEFPLFFNKCQREGLVPLP
jgi:hypothetical protein